MPAQPPKISLWSERVVEAEPGVLDPSHNVPTAWQYFCGAWGYWLPHHLNETRAVALALRKV